MRIFCCFFGLTLFYSSCIKEVHNNFDFEEKIVVYSYPNTSDSIIKLILLNNQPVSASLENNNEKLPYLKNATVTISDGNKSTLLTFYEGNSESFYYTDSNSFKFEEGKNYYLNINSPDGRYARSSLKIPHSSNILSASVDTSSVAKITLYDNMMSISREVTLSVNLNAANAYHFVYAKVYGRTIWYDNKDTSNYSTVEDFYFNPNSSLPLQLNGSQILSTKNEIGVATNFKTIDFFSVEIDSVEFILITVEENYYKFLKSKQIQSSNTNDPFAEPALLFSNIENGLGIFTGLTTRSKKIILKE